MAISLSREHLKRYHGIARLLISSDLVKQTGLDDALPDGAALPEDYAGGGAAQRDEAPGQELREDLEAMGPTFVKLGQLLSTRPDLLDEKVDRRSRSKRGRR